MAPLILSLGTMCELLTRRHGRSIPRIHGTGGRPGRFGEDTICYPRPESNPRLSNP